MFIFFGVYTKKIWLALLSFAKKKYFTKNKGGSPLDLLLRPGHYILNY